ncbi:Transcription elongation factor 1 [Paramecium bursaria]
MGGRRKSTKIQKKEKPITIRTIFDCAICGYKNCIFVKIQKIHKKAKLNCVKCKHEWETVVKGMDEAIDVFHKWQLHIKKKPNLQTEDRFEDKLQDENDFQNVLLAAQNNEQESEDSLDQQKDQESLDSLISEDEIDDDEEEELQKKKLVKV